MKKQLTIAITLLISGMALTGCGSRPIHHHKAEHTRTTAVKKVHSDHPKRVSQSKKTHKVNSKDIDKSGMSDNDIKKDSQAVHQKSSSQPVD